MTKRDRDWKKKIQIEWVKEKQKEREDRRTERYKNIGKERQ